jgi:type IV pilus assembly protein PilB
MARTSSKIKRLLVEEGLVTAEQWGEVQAPGMDVVEALLDRGILHETSLMEVLGRSAGVPPVDLRMVKPDPVAVGAVGEDHCKEHGVLPLTKNGDVLTIAVSDPYDVILFDDLKRLTNCHVRAVYAHGAMLRHAIDQEFDAGAAQVQEMMDEVDSEQLSAAPDEAEETQELGIAVEGEESPAVKLVNLIVLRALKEKASDIHIEPGERKVKVRFRIDGRLKEAIPPVSKSLLPALASRLKILAKLDIAERYKPQDGKFQIRFEGRKIDFRLSILPVVGGEKSVIRILDAGSLAMSLDVMGWEPKALSDIRHAIAQPYGMMLVTGPTGSGKSTTLYSCVRAVAEPTVNVTTVEDPVEYRMDGINQVPVNPKRGMTFAGALRSILRQDPDIVLIGEIRDKETADIAVKAALTGHLVLSTLHTNDASSTITRLVDMGIDPFMVSSSLLCIAAQRLGRRLCPHCREEADYPHERLLSVGFKEEDFDGMQLFAAHPKGCPRCSGGYKGRFAVLETLPLTQRLCRMVVEGAAVDDMKRQALEEGMLTLRRVGVLNAMRGMTSLEEVLRITLDD